MNEAEALKIAIKTIDQKLKGLLENSCSRTCLCCQTFPTCEGCPVDFEEPAEEYQVFSCTDYQTAIHKIEHRFNAQREAFETRLAELEEKEQS